MNASTLLNTSSESFRKLMSNGNVYRVPTFQRDYSWEEEQWEDLWADLISPEQDQIHYMGYAVFQAKADEESLIIDGQQRFATLSVVILAGLSVLQHWATLGIDQQENIERIEELRRNFIGYKSPSSLATRSKLSLNHNDDDFYQSYLVGLRPPPARSRLRPSVRLLLGASEYFFKKFKERYDENRSGQALADFIDKRIGTSLVFTTIQVGDDLRAYQVFETLNARGVKLSSTDLLKNYLFSVVHKTSPSDIPEVERRWNYVSEQLGEEDLPTFVRHYWNSKHVLAPKNNLFRSIKSDVSTNREAFDFLGELENAAPIYLAFSRPEDPNWAPEQRRWVEALRIFNVSQCYCLLFAGKSKWDPSSYTSLLRLSVVLSFRYSVIGGLNPNALEGAYHKAALGISRGELKNVQAVASRLREVYPNDEKFKADFAAKTLNTSNTRGRKLARYILLQIEAAEEGVASWQDDVSATIEHVLPENPSAPWRDTFSEEDQDFLTHRLGNLALLEAPKNRHAGQLAFPEKVPIYQRSNYRTTQRIAQSAEWEPDSIRSRQDRMAEKAAAIWRIDF